MNIKSILKFKYKIKLDQFFGSFFVLEVYFVLLSQTLCFSVLIMLEQIMEKI